MTEHKRRVGFLNMLVGVLILLAGASVSVEWIADSTSWQVGIKGPVWILLGVVLMLIGREFVDEAQ